MSRLAAYVHVAGRVFGPADDVPDDVAVQITNPKAWEGGVLPTVVSAPAPALDGDADAPAVVPVSPDVPVAAGGTAGSPPPPPRSGPGSGAPVWRAYAARNDVTVPADAGRLDVIAALDAAGVPTEEVPS